MHIGTARVGKEKDATLRIQHNARTFTSEFIDERGNRILLAAIADDKGVAYTMVGGVMGTIENTVTTLEAIELMTILAQALGLNIVVEASSVT